MDRKTLFSAEMVIGLSALLVSLVAVIVGVYSAYTDRTYARASVWPRVELNFHLSTYDDGSEYSLKMSNHGTGPAIIKNVQIEYQGKYLKKWADVMALLGNYKDSINLSVSNIANIVLSPEKTTTNFQVRDKSPKMSNDVREILKPMNIMICYCSVYDECWVKSRGEMTKPVEQCIANAQKDFLQ